MKKYTWFLTEMGVITTASILTLLVLAESIFPPWAPYFVIYAALAIVLPIGLRVYTFGSLGDVLRSKWRVIFSILVIAVVLNTAIPALYRLILDRLGLSNQVFYSFDLALAALSGKAGSKFGISSDTAMLIYAMFILLWAPVGEELFYRGYVQGVLRRSQSFRTAMLVSAGFFGVRHATHFFFLWPEVPLAAAASWVLSAFVFGILMSYLYEKTHSLYPPMLVHLVVNLVELFLSS